MMTTTRRTSHPCSTSHHHCSCRRRMFFLARFLVWTLQTDGTKPLLYSTRQPAPQTAPNDDGVFHWPAKNCIGLVLLANLFSTIRPGRLWIYETVRGAWFARKSAGRKNSISISVSRADHKCQRFWICLHQNLAVVPHCERECWVGATQPHFTVPGHSQIFSIA
jgi:hypothetical protein